MTLSHTRAAAAGALAIAFALASAGLSPSARPPNPKRRRKRSTTSTRRRSRSTCRIRASPPNWSITCRPRHGAVAAEVPWARRRSAGRADLRQGHPSLLRGAGQGVAARALLEDRHERRRPRHRRAGDRGRGDDQVARQVPRHARGADRSAQDHRGAGAAAAEDGQADLLPDQRHALTGKRRARNAHRAGLSPHRRGDAVHPATSATTSSR